MYRGAVNLCIYRIHAHMLRRNASETATSGYELENRGFLALERWVFLTDTDDLHRYEELPKELAYPTVTGNDSSGRNGGNGGVEDAINEEHQGNRQLRLWLQKFD